MIVFLASSLVMEYLYNAYFRNYVDSLGPVLIPLASVAFGVSSATIAIRLYVGKRKIETIQEAEVQVRKKTTSRRRQKKTPIPNGSPQGPPATPSMVSTQKPESKAEQKPDQAGPSSPKPVTQPGPSRTGIPSRIPSEKEARPSADKTR